MLFVNLTEISLFHFLVILFHELVQVFSLKVIVLIDMHLVKPLPCFILMSNLFYIILKSDI